MRCQRQYLAAIQAQLLIIIKDSIHILDPESIHRPIKHNPILLTRPILAAFPHRIGEHTIDPLPCSLVKHAVELAHCDGFGVEHAGVDFVVTVVLEGCEGRF